MFLGKLAKFFTTNARRKFSFAECKKKFGMAHKLNRCQERWGKLFKRLSEGGLDQVSYCSIVRTIFQKWKLFVEEINVIYQRMRKNLKLDNSYS